MKNLLEVKDLKVYFYTEDGVIPAVDGVSFEVKPGEVIGIVGESGCGKSVTAMSLLKLIPYPPGKILQGSMNFDGRELTALSDSEMRKIRGNDIAMIFQEPMTSLNPVFTIGNQIGEAISLHQGLKDKEVNAKCIEMLKLVGIPRPEKVVNEYPHSLSGGMRQRAMIAMALCCNPKLLIADEPTTALDVTIQAQILELMKALKDKINTSVMLITHDLGVVAEMAEHVVVMYAGKIVEDTDVLTLFKNPQHPYTVGLLASKPKLEEEREKLESIQGAVPNPLNMPDGCHFHPRCRHVMDVCKVKMPPLLEESPGHKIRCWLFNGHREGGHSQ
ncbi:MAG: ABC transporter ATP-binding protein [Dethiobacter sp.]|jgi:oligopeptide/dipeptide ABC transporter ATP-binding protein|nr:ABC transporter ATP-binding protein [Dethiobacter sp.]